MKTLTIFTPTYNRSNLLMNLYNSLINQTNKDFLWLVINDGSTDDTESIIKSFQNDNKIEIEYIKKSNGGKHTAHNTAISVCSTELFFCVDSDDYLTKDAVDTILMYRNSCRQEQLLGFYFRKGTTDEKYHGVNFPDNLDRIYLTELYDRYKFNGEMAIVLKTDLVRSYKFPVFDGENFVTETVFYNQINHIAPMVLSNKIIYIFDYMIDGYTNNSLKLALRNPKGTAMGYLSSAYYLKSLYSRIKKAAQYYAWLYIMQVDSEKFRALILPYKIRIAGKVLSLHYRRLFKKYKDMK